MENTTEKAIRYLKDLHAAESGTADIFEGLSKDGDLEADLRSSAASWYQHTQAHQSAIQQRLHALGSDNSGAKDFVNNVLSKASDLLNIGHDDEDKLTQDLIKAYASVSLNVGAYESLRAFASVAGDQDLASFAQQGRSDDENLAKDVLKAIGRKAPSAIQNATDSGATTGVPSTGTAAGY
ncbi:DUF892 family protein [bacterium]|nr:MAG: DUF892 family protein [bacterium]